MSIQFETSAFDRLQTFLKKHDALTQAERLTPDASTREFFRVRFNDKTAIACVYPEAFDESLPQIDVSNLFLQDDLPVAEIYEIDYECGLVVHEDFGDRILRESLKNAEPNIHNELISKAVSLIAKIQNATTRAYELKSIASKLKFDEEKLVWELDFFKTHYFASLKKKPLSLDTDEELTTEFVDLSRELETYATVLTHRDFHTANLMLSQENDLLIIDHQDARIGSPAYDLVSLLLDRITESPTQDYLRDKKVFFLSERERLGLERISLSDFEYEFELMTIQRCLKAIGTFSNQAANFDKLQYLPYIQPMFEVVIKACERINKYPKMQSVIREQIT